MGGLFSREAAWRTGISDIDEQGPRLRGYAVSELAADGSVSFSDLLFLTATGELPGPAQAHLLKVMLGVTVAQGISVTGVATRTALAAGVPIQVAICAGLTTIGDDVGGAGEALARDLQAAVPLARARALSAGEQDGLAVEVAAALEERYMRERGHVPGFGHPIHRDGDPRAVLMLDQARALGLAGVYVRILQELEARVARRKGRRIAPNTDGAHGALLGELGMPWPYARPLLMMGRLVGLAGISAECALGEVRGLPAGLLDFQYDGPAARPLPGKG